MPKKYLRKSALYKCVFQNKNGTWFYRTKRILVKGEPPVYFEKSGFATEQAAHRALQSAIRLEQFGARGFGVKKVTATFGELFQEFLKDGCTSESSTKKYKSLYDSQLAIWKDRPIQSISESEIDTILLSLTLKKRADGQYKGYSNSYQASVRKLLKVFYYYVHSKMPSIPGDIAQNLGAHPYKLRVLSLFSGIGAPEQALQELGIDYELVKFCEIDEKAARAYSLLHGLDWENEQYCNINGKYIDDVERLDADYCKSYLPNFDIMFFGFPCQDLSTAGVQKGLLTDKKALHPSYTQILFGDLDGLTRSGLFYRALHIALWKKPKFMIAENVAALIGKKFKPDFEQMLWRLQNAGYNIHFYKLNSKDYGVPQNRTRVFMVMIRDDTNIHFIPPDPTELLCKAEDWFEDNVSDEYYLNEKQSTKMTYLMETEGNFAPNLHKDVISCLTANCGTPTARQTLVKDEKGIRTLSSEELMKFQGFPPEYGTLLRQNGFSRADVGHFVGNSITVPVIKAIIANLIDSLTYSLYIDIKPDKYLVARYEEDYVQPLFAYMGNKSKILPVLRYAFPNQNWLKESLFVDLFAGSGFVGVNTSAGRVILNEKDPFLVGIYKALASTPPEKAWEMVESVVKKYALSATNETGYYQCRTDYNKIPYEERNSTFWYWGLALVYHGYNRSLVHFNKKNEFNTSFGKKKCNLELMKERFFPFAEKLYTGDYDIRCGSYKDCDLSHYMDEDVFLYVDPPYLITTAPYNRYWSEKDEHELYDYLDDCSDKGYNWILSNVVQHGNKKNEILIEWLQTHNYKVYFLKRNYTTSMATIYSTKERKKDLEEDKGSVEIVVINTRYVLRL